MTCLKLSMGTLSLLHHLAGDKGLAQRRSLLESVGMNQCLDDTDSESQQGAYRPAKSIMH